MIVELEALVPMTIGGVIGLFANSFLAFLSLIIADKIIEHRIEGYRIFIMSMASYFAVPLVFNLIGFTGISRLTELLSNYVIPLITWGILGIFLLNANIKTKWDIAKTGFIVYSILTFVGLPNIIENVIFKAIGI